MRSRSPKPNRPLPAPLRALAFALAWLVLGLTIVSASPEAHAFVHQPEQAASSGHCDHDHSAPTESAEHVCAVVLFSGGVDLPTADFLPLPAMALVPAAATEYAPLFLPAPRYLRQPERGPPAV